MERAWSVVEVFDHFCRATGIDDVITVATSAIRDARNGPEFVEKAVLPVRVLSREEEARYGYLAAINSSTLKHGAVLDLGGGSMQLVAVDDRRAVDLESWPLGAVRMTERFGDDIEALRAHVTKAIDETPWGAGSGDRRVGVGGTVRTLAAAACAAAQLPSIGVQGYHLTAEALEELIGQLAALPAAERGKVDGIKPARADIILAGAVVVH